MTGISLIITFVLAIILMIISISKWKVPPFIAIMLTSLFFAIIAGVPLVDEVRNDEIHSGIVTLIGQGFSGIFGSIGIVIILGSLIGAILESTGAALKIADSAISLIGKKYPVLAMQLMGWIVSIPVFCDSGFVILNPIRRSIALRANVSPVALTIGLASGLYLSHVFIPPTPGPIAAANSLGISDNLLLVMGFGVLCSVLPLVVSLWYAHFISKKIQVDEDKNEQTNVESYELLKSTYSHLPNLFISIAPIVFPILLMALSSIANMIGYNGVGAEMLKFLGTPMISLSVGLLFAYVQLYMCGKSNLFLQLTNDTLKVVGPILFITGAGGVLGKVVASSSLVDFISANVSFYQSIGIFFPFILAAIFKTAQGSSTVALVTTASIIAPLLPSLGFISPAQISLVCMAVGAGAMTVSHANDSYFWIVTNFSGLNTQKGYKVQTVTTFLLGLSAIVEIYIIYLIVS